MQMGDTGCGRSLNIDPLMTNEVQCSGISGFMPRLVAVERFH